MVKGKWRGQTIPANGPLPYPLLTTPPLANVSRPAHHRRHEVLDRRRADLLHHGVSFGT
jgi:hypothetical protein